MVLQCKRSVLGIRTNHLFCSESDCPASGSQLHKMTNIKSTRSTEESSVSHTKHKLLPHLNREPEYCINTPTFLWFHKLRYLFCISFRADASTLSLHGSVIDAYISFFLIIYAFAYILAWKASSLTPWHKERSYFRENTLVLYWLYMHRRHVEWPQWVSLCGTFLSPSSLQSRCRKDSISVSCWMNCCYRTGIFSVLLVFNTEVSICF